MDTPDFLLSPDITYELLRAGVSRRGPSWPEFSPEGGGVVSIGSALVFNAPKRLFRICVFEYAPMELDARRP
ncbi:hypothetical protein, partial [Streptomyces katrae]|uniref:hypothetical protein n=1 Tax=Streptomyces katrae TaxID=68223 RepID=UPI001B80AA90